MSEIIEDVTTEKAPSEVTPDNIFAVALVGCVVGFFITLFVFLSAEFRDGYTLIAILVSCLMIPVMVAILSFLPKGNLKMNLVCVLFTSSFISSASFMIVTNLGGSVDAEINSLYGIEIGKEFTLGETDDFYPSESQLNAYNKVDDNDPNVTIIVRLFPNTNIVKQVNLWISESAELNAQEIYEQMIIYLNEKYGASISLYVKDARDDGTNYIHVSKPRFHSSIVDVELGMLHPSDFEKNLPVKPINQEQKDALFMQEERLRQLIINK